MYMDDSPCVIMLKEKTVIARKRHACAWHHGRRFHFIEKGDEYRYVVYLDEDMKFKAEHICYECYWGYKKGEEMP